MFRSCCSILLALLLCGKAAAQPLHQLSHEPAVLAPRAGIPLSITVPLHGRLAPQGFSRRALLEMGAVALTGIGHLAFSELDASAVFIPLASLGWGGYVFHRARRDPDFLRETGFTRERLGPAFRDATLVAAGSLAVMAGVGTLQGSLTLDRDMVPLLVLYPAWGLVQQFLVQGMVARNLAEGPGWVNSPRFVTPTTATMFSLVHVPNWKLTAGTFGLGLAYTPLYLRHRNLWPLGLYHGWLGVFYYFWVLERNPWDAVAH